MLSAAPSFNNNVKHHVRERDMLENIFKSEKYFNWMLGGWVAGTRINIFKKIA